MSCCQAHDWELVYRDGPTDTNDWECRRCGARTSNHGPDKPKDQDEALRTPTH